MIHEGDAIEQMAGMDAASIDAIVTDPPYSLAFMGRKWDFHGGPRGFQEWCEAWASEALRLLKPGGHLLAFGGTRTYHRLACGIEDAGFEIRDCLAYMYGSGFPKSLNLDGERQGWGTALKPAFEPVVLARKPLGGTVAANVTEHGTGALNVDGCRVETADNLNGGAYSAERKPSESEWVKHGGTIHSFAGREYEQPEGRWPANVILDEWWEPILRLRDTLDSDAWQLLSEWCNARNGEVPPMRHPNRRAAKSGEAPEVLLAPLPTSVDVGEPAGGGAPDEGAQALRGVPGEDAEGEEGECEARPGESELEGFVYEQGLSLHQPAGGQGAARASDRDGEDSRTSLDAGRNGPPHQRHQDGQPIGEPGSPHAECPHSPSRGRLSGTAGASRPRREVFLRDVPEAWLRFFDFTGEVARMGAAELLDEQAPDMGGGGGGIGDGAIYGDPGSGQTRRDGRIDPNGGASRFFYCAKASRGEREAGLDGPLTGRTDDGYGSIQTPKLDRATPRENWTPREIRNGHPTVKPIDLMRWLVRLITPPGGTVLDPFAGSGTTGVAATLEGFGFTGIEREREYVRIAEARIAWWSQFPPGTDTAAALGAAAQDRAHAEAGQTKLTEART